MVRIKVRHVRAGVAGASSLVMLGNAALGCAANADAEDASATQSGDTVVNPGTGTFELASAYTGNDYGPAYTVLTTNSTDEFVRVGERITLQVPQWMLWTLLDEPNDTPDVARIRGLRVTFDVHFLRKGLVTSSHELVVTSWSGDQLWNLVAHTGEIVIPSKVDTVAIGVTVVDPAATGGPKTVEISDTDVIAVPVFGGEYPNKHVIFDNVYSTLRNRVIEGGNPIGNGQLGITYTDWRADTVVDRSSIDTQIGTATSYGRFGTIEMPIYGDIQYEVSYGYALNDYWQPEQKLVATTSSRVLHSPGRTAYETSLWMSPYSQKVDVYFHVKAFLSVDYTRYGSNVKTRRYNQGDRLLVRERWDNLNGHAGANYELPIDAR